MKAIQLMGFWPGLPKLWYRGDLHALMAALLFGAMVSFGLIATFQWPYWISPWALRGLWALVLGWASFAAIQNGISWKSLVQGPRVTESQDQDFREAQDCYLRGDYFEAEAALHRIFTSGVQDVEAAILMVSILRRTRRWAQALYCIDRLLLLDKATPWRRELACERATIQESMGKLESPSTESSTKEQAVLAS